MSNTEWHRDSSEEASRPPSTAVENSPRHSLNNDKGLYSDIDKDLEAGDDTRQQRERSQSPDTSKPEKGPPPVDSYLVEFDGPDDPGDPRTWSKAKKWTVTMSMASLVFTVTFASSVFSTCIEVTSKEFHISSVVATLGVSLFLVGFVLGPVVFGPASELYGRKIPLFSGYVVFAIFQIPVAVARNVETIMLGRFLGGFAASAPLAVVGGALADIWDPIERAYAVCWFAFGAFGGPTAGPVIGSFLTESYLGWRWTAWITLIMAALFGIIGLFVIPETSAPRILQTRAKDLRYKTKNWALHAKSDENRLDARTVTTVYLLRPFIMFFQEPILLLITLYMSFIYGMLYLFFEAFPVAFSEVRGWSLGVGSLPFTSFLVGTAIGSGLIAVSTATNFKRSFQKHGKVIPEERLPPMIVGALLLPIGLFWFAWTSNPHVLWVPQVLAIALIATGTLACFWQGMNYIIDCYLFYSNSAIAVNTFVRSIVGAGFPLFARQMYQNIGVDWGSSLLGFLTLVFAPVPILFYLYGEKIRQKSRWAPT